jgi:hypothetical protein
VARIGSLRGCVLATGGTAVGSGADGTHVILREASIMAGDSRRYVEQVEALVADCWEQRMSAAFGDPTADLMQLVSCRVVLRLVIVARTVYGTSRQVARAQEVWQAADERYRHCITNASAPATCALPVNVAVDGSDVSGTE